jgi:hypothetical protein
MTLHYWLADPPLKRFSHCSVLALLRIHLLNDPFFKESEAMFTRLMCIAVVMGGLIASATAPIVSRAFAADCSWAQDPQTGCNDSDTYDCSKRCDDNNYGFSCASGTAYGTTQKFRRISGGSGAPFDNNIAECNQPVTCTTTPYPAKVCNVLIVCGGNNADNTCYLCTRTFGAWVPATSFETTTMGCGGA